MTPKTIEFVRFPEGGMFVFPSNARIVATCEDLRKKAEEAGEDEKLKRALIEEAERLPQTVEAWRIKAKGNIESRTFNITPYTRRQRLAAIEAASTWEKDGPKHNDELFQANLTAACAGLTFDEYLDLEEPFAQALYELVQEVNNPDPGKFVPAVS